MNSEKWTFFLFCFLNRAVVRQLLIHWLTSMPVKSGAGCLICVCHNGWRSTITELSFLAFQCTSVGSWFGSGAALTKTGTVTADVASQQVAVPHGPPGMTYVIVMTVFKMNLKELHREREIFNLLINSPNGCSAWGWARLKAGARTFFQIFLLDPNTQSTFMASYQVINCISIGAVGAWTL